MKVSKYDDALLLTLRRRGMTAAQIVETIGYGSVSGVNDAIRNRMRGVKFRQSLCWSCVHAVPNIEKRAGCSWSLEYKPVDGWRAIRRDLPKQSGVGTYGRSREESYMVEQCPQYESEPERARQDVMEDDV